MRAIKEIIIHCSASPEGVKVKTSAIRHMHKKVNGWSDIGYHFVFELDASEHLGRPIERTGAGVEGRNENTIHICYVGGLDKNGKPKDTRTPEQKEAIYRRVEKLLEQFPDATVHGHNEFSSKACPCFNVPEDWAAWKAETSGLSLDITPGLSPDEMRDEDFDDGSELPEL